ncbi:BglG family transcription antiterminator [Clostridium ganghwense]|uniref:BglG family transcription antiterminator n=1 Tax=Clostridium ganghwense TaxID=312089 RepID=A0ABT4CN67_9CLOT|nr:BglG family transcription antiterminator [Clostridium ganghwense]MCY6369883.1 BglG family transcription antiterminator [Clostridium ganghwense]
MPNKERIKNQIELILLESKEPITVSKIAQYVSVSTKTIRNYLKEMEKKWVENGIQFIKKPNVGVYLKITEQERAELKRKLNNDKDKKIDYSPRYRREYILKTLFKNRYTYTIQLLAEDLYCSKSTIVNDLVYVQKWIENHGLSLKRKQNQGLWIEGNEKTYRRAMMDLFYEIKEEQNSKSIGEDEVEKLDYRIDFVNYKKLKHLFPRTNLYKIQYIVQQAEDKLGYYFTDQAFINLITHIAITIERVKNKNEITMGKEMFDTLIKEYEFKVAEWVIEKISEEFGMKFPESEVGYISLHMLGARIQEDIPIKDYDALLESQNENYMKIAEEIIRLVSEILRVDLSNDKLLFTGLVLHLRPTMARLKYGLKLRNPMLERIKREYTSIFGAAWACSSIFEKKMGVSITEDEVGYIALHIAVAVERVSNKIKTVIVCSSGIGTSQLVAGRLRKKINELEIVTIIPLSRLSEELINEADLIVSTIPIAKNNPKIAYISTLVDEVDILKIRSSIKNIQISACEKKIKENEEVNDKELNTKKIINQELCFIENEKREFDEIIQYYGQLMMDKGYVKEGFCRNVLEREKKASTVIGKGIAIPHSKPEYVEESKVCIIKLENPIIRNNQEINIIIILAIKFKDISTTRAFFKNLYSVLDNELLIDKIKKTNDKLEIINIFLNGGNDNE